MVSFTARACRYIGDVGARVDVLALAETDHGSGRTLEIQRAAAFDEQDERLGMATYCIVLDGGPTNYGGIAEWDVTTSAALEIVLEPSACDALGTDRIRVVVPSREVAPVEQAMRDLISRS